MKLYKAHLQTTSAEANLQTGQLWPCTAGHRVLSACSDHSCVPCTAKQFHFCSLLVSMELQRAIAALLRSFSAVMRCRTCCFANENLQHGTPRISAILIATGFPYAGGLQLVRASPREL